MLVLCWVFAVFGEDDDEGSGHLKHQSSCNVVKMLRYKAMSSSRTRYWGSFKYPSLSPPLPSPSIPFHPPSRTDNLITTIISHAPKSRRLFCSPAPVHSHIPTLQHLTLTDNPTEAVCKKVLVLQDFVFHIERRQPKRLFCGLWRHNLT